MVPFRIKFLQDASQINIVNENSKSQVVTFQKENNRVGVVSTISQPTLILKDGLHGESLRDTKNKMSVSIKEPLRVFYKINIIRIISANVNRPVFYAVVIF